MQNNTLGGMIASMPLGMRIIQSDYMCFTCAEMETIPPELPVLLCPKHYQAFKKEIDRRFMDGKVTPTQVNKLNYIIKIIGILRTLANQPS